ncbi:MAG: hypothetical protein AB8C84_13135 [Oligoflexales bacterium]
MGYIRHTVKFLLLIFGLTANFCFASSFKWSDKDSYEGLSNYGDDNSYGTSSILSDVDNLMSDDFDLSLPENDKEVSYTQEEQRSADIKQWAAYEECLEQENFSENVKRLQQEYLLLMDIFNDFAVCVDSQGEMIRLVFECSKSTFETLISSMIRVESARRATMTQPWAGYSTWMLSGVASIVLGASGILIPAVIIGSAGIFLGGLDVGYNSYCRTLSETKTSELIVMGSAACHILNDQCFEEEFAPNPHCRHAGSATSYELHRQMKGLLRVEKIFESLLNCSHKNLWLYDEVFERSDNYQEKQKTMNLHLQLRQLSEDLTIDDRLANSFSLNLKEQNKLLEKVLYLSSHLNGKVLANEIDARKILRRL